MLHATKLCMGDRLQKNSKEIRYVPQIWISMIISCRLQLQAFAIHDFIRRLGWNHVVFVNVSLVHILQQDHNAYTNRNGFELSRTTFKGRMIDVMIINQTWHKISLKKGVFSMFKLNIENTLTTFKNLSFLSYNQTARASSSQVS